MNPDWFMFTTDDKKFLYDILDNFVISISESYWPPILYFYLVISLYDADYLSPFLCYT